MKRLNNRAEEGQNDKQHNKASSTAEAEAAGVEGNKKQETETKESQSNLRCLLTKMQKLRTTLLLQILLCVYRTEHRKQVFIPKNAVQDLGQRFRDDK